MHLGNCPQNQVVPSWTRPAAFKVNQWIQHGEQGRKPVPSRAYLGERVDMCILGEPSCGSTSPVHTPLHTFLFVLCPACFATTADRTGHCTRGSKHSELTFCVVGRHFSFFRASRFPVGHSVARRGELIGSRRKRAGGVCFLLPIGGASI